MMAIMQYGATTWSMPPYDLTLTPATVHVWPVDLDRPAADETLAPDERERAARFRFERDRLRFVAGRAALRCILALYLGLAPHEVAFEQGTHGKPALAASLVAALSSSALSQSKRGARC